MVRVAVMFRLHCGIDWDFGLSVPSLRVQESGECPFRVIIGSHIDSSIFPTYKDLVRAQAYRSSVLIDRSSRIVSALWDICVINSSGTESPVKSYNDPDIQLELLLDDSSIIIRKSHSI